MSPSRLGAACPKPCRGMFARLAVPPGLDSSASGRVDAKVASMLAELSESDLTACAALRVGASVSARLAMTSVGPLCPRY